MDIMLADDHFIFRQGLIALLTKNKKHNIIGEANNGRELLDLLKDYRPDVVILDISMPDMNGIECAYEVHRLYPDIKLCALSMHKSISFVREMLSAGVKGYVLKDQAFSELELALNKIISDEQFLSEGINYKLNGEDSSLEILSSREREILQLLAEGNSNKIIAEKLFISVKTVETHRSRIMQKTNLKNLQELTRYAIQQGLTPL